MIYLASPYSHPNPAVMQWRYERACLAAAEYIRRGEAVFSPVAHSHPIALAGGLDATDHETWLRIDAEMMTACNAVHVLMLGGWQESRGVREEVRLALERGLPVEYVNPDELTENERNEQ